MQKTKKQFLGFAGLVAVGIMTVVAYAIPAAAAEDAPPSKSDSATDITVHVTGGVNEARITYPRDRSTVVEPIVHGSYYYAETTNVKTYIEYDDNGQTVRELIDEFNPTNSAGEHPFVADLNRYGGREREYKIVTVATDQYGKEDEDTVTFSYRAVAAEFSKPAANGDPVLEIEVNNEVQQILVSVYDKNGDPLFVDKNGKQVPLVLTRDDIDPVTGKITKVLPFAELNAEDGLYSVVISAYNGKSEEGATLISMVTIDTEYALVKPVDPNQPETPPNTGLVLGDLNISRIDYLVTGLIVFGTVSGFALYLVYRKSRR